MLLARLRAYVRFWDWLISRMSSRHSSLGELQHVTFIQPIMQLKCASMLRIINLIPA